MIDRLATTLTEWAMGGSVRRAHRADSYVPFRIRQGGRLAIAAYRAGLPYRYCALIAGWTR